MEILRENIYQIEFEKIANKMYKHLDLLKHCSGVYRSHETYRMYMAFCDGWKTCIDFNKEKQK